MAKEKVMNQCAFDETSISLIGVSSTKYFIQQNEILNPVGVILGESFCLRLKLKSTNPEFCFNIGSRLIEFGVFSNLISWDKIWSF